MKYLDKAKNEVVTDVTWTRIGRLTAKGARALPGASVEYVVDKFPAIGWLPRYDYRWLVNDVIAGLTLGLMLIPQGLSYAKLAGIPVQYGLMSSWLPSAIYAFMGTSKGRVLLACHSLLIVSPLLTSRLCRPVQRPNLPYWIADLGDH